MPGMSVARPGRPGFYFKVLIGAAVMAVLGLGFMFAAVNVVARRVIYDGVLEIARGGKAVYAGELDGRFLAAGQALRGMAAAIGAVPEENFAAVAKAFTADLGFVENAFIGFADGSVISGLGWVPEGGGADRPWFEAAKAVGEGAIAVVGPYFSPTTGAVAADFSKWLPGLGGSGASVGFSLSVDYILEGIFRGFANSGGYLMLICPLGQIVAHPNPEHAPGPAGGFRNLRDIPGGGFMMDIAAAGAGFARFGDLEIGPAHFISAPLESVGWSLIAVIPASATRIPVIRSLAEVMAALAFVLIGLFAFAVFFFTRITKNMEETGLAEERLRHIFDIMPLASTFRDADRKVLHCNAEVQKIFGLRDRQEYIERSSEFSPEFQPDGSLSSEKAAWHIREAFETGRQRFDWMHQTLDGEPIPTEVTLIRIDLHSGHYIVTFIRDLRELYEVQRKERMVMQRMQTMLDTSPIVCAIFDESNNVLEANREVERLFDIPDRQIFVDRFFDFSPEFQPDGTPSREKSLANIGKALDAGKARFEWMYQTLDGKPIPCEETLERVRMDGRDVIISYSRDLRDFYRYKETELVAQQRLQAMLDSSPLSCFIFDENFGVLEVNQETLKLFGLSDARECANGFFDSLSPKYQPDGRLSIEKLGEKIRTALEFGRAHFEWMYQTPEGKPIPSEVTIVSVTLDGKDLLIGYTRDLREINEAFSMVKQLEKLAFTDALTGARNRRFFTETAERELLSCAAGGRDFSVVLFDIDDFKRVNDTHGHGIGDEVLKIIVARACHALKQDTLVARYGGEEFVVMLPGVSHENAMKVAWQVHKRVEDSPFMAGGREIRITVSLGVASKTGDCTSLSEIIESADRALYRAKQSGKNRAVSYEAISSDFPRG